MKTRTKCTLAICGLFVVEILPVPISSVYSLYVARKRPNWLPRVVERLYRESPAKNQSLMLPLGHDPMETRKKCTRVLVLMFMVDLIVPVVIPTALFVVLKRPLWFQNLVFKLYSDLMLPAVPASSDGIVLKSASPEELLVINQKLAELEKKNRAYAKRIGSKHGRRHSQKH